MTPKTGKFGLLRWYYNKFRFNYFETRIIKKSLYILHTKKTDMGLVKQSPIVIFPILLQEARYHSIVRDMGQRNHHITIIIENISDIP